MFRKQIEEGVRDVLSPEYGRESCVKWAGQFAGIEIEASDLTEPDPDLIIQLLKDEACSQAEELIRDKIEEDLSEDGEDQREWNWLALSKWANGRWGINTNDRELKKVGRDGMFDYLLERAQEAIERADFSPVKGFLAEDFGRQSLSNWLAHQYTLSIPPEKFLGLSQEEAISLVFEEIQRLYGLKDIAFPVEVGLSRFLAEQGGGEKYDREGLARWANGRFQAQLAPDTFRGKSRGAIRQGLMQCSSSFSNNGHSLVKVDEYLDQAYGERNG